MNPIFNDSVVKLEIFHREFNIDNKDNLSEIPDKPAVFGVFAVINDTPVHPRYIGSCENLQKKVRELYESPNSEGLRKFMQEEWIQMLCYEIVDNLTSEQLLEKERKWISFYKPGVDSDGEYLEYSYEWPYKDDGTLKEEYENIRKPDF